jgi:hypothetical protein
MLKKTSVRVALGVVATLVVLLIVIATRPATYAVERSATVEAPVDVVFAQVKDFRKWEAWSPWAKRDPAMKTKFEGTQGEVGAVYSWEGNDETGSGRMTILALKPDERVDFKLEFIKPFESTANNGFKVEPAGTGTKITWFMSGDNTFMGKAFSLVMDMDAMIGKDFEQGLGDIKKIAEETAKAPPPKPAEGETENAAAKP